MKKLIFLSILITLGITAFAQVKPKQISPGTNGQLIIVRSGIAQWDSLKWADISGVPDIPSGTVTNVSASAPLHVTNPTTTPALTIDQATGTTAGYLSASDWANFNGKASLSDLSATAPIAYDSLTGKISITTGDLVQGSNVILTGTLTDRLVGNGNVTINAIVNPSDIYGTEDTVTHVVVSGDISSGLVSITLNHAVKSGRIPEVFINGVKARWPAITWSGTILIITNSKLPYNVSSGDEVDIKYVY